MLNMQPRHDELAWFIDSLADIERLISGTIAALLICMLTAVGVYIISQLLGAWRRRLTDPGSRRTRTITAVDTWRESAARLREVEGDDDV